MVSSLVTHTLQWVKPWEETKTIGPSQLLEFPQSLLRLAMSANSKTMAGTLLIHRQRKT